MFRATSSNAARSRFDNPHSRAAGPMYMRFTSPTAPSKGRTAPQATARPFIELWNAPYAGSRRTGLRAAVDILDNLGLTATTGKAGNVMPSASRLPAGECRFRTGTGSLRFSIKLPANITARSMARRHMQLSALLAQPSIRVGNGRPRKSSTSFLLLLLPDVDELTRTGLDAELLRSLLIGWCKADRELALLELVDAANRFSFAVRGINLLRGFGWVYLKRARDRIAQPDAAGEQPQVEVPRMSRERNCQ